MKPTNEQSDVRRGGDITMSSTQTQENTKCLTSDADVKSSTAEIEGA